jgi:crotonobetainyl-CoA:carnitine CoA-transferase CaiB-like acyl-CoA transferase
VPGKFAATPTAMRHYAPGLGEHTNTILNEFGFSQAQIATLLEMKVAAQGERPAQQ